MKPQGTTASAIRRTKMGKIIQEDQNLYLVEVTTMLQLLLDKGLFDKETKNKLLDIACQRIEVAPSSDSDDDTKEEVKNASDSVAESALEQTNTGAACSVKVESEIAENESGFITKGVKLEREVTKHSPCIPTEGWMKKLNRNYPGIHDYMNTLETRISVLECHNFQEMRTGRSKKKMRGRERGRARTGEKNR